MVLTGDVGRVLPLRLSAAEGAVLNHELESLGIEPQAAARIRRALLPKELGYNQRVVDTVARGSHWQQLNCAIQDGVRCRITYRSMDDARPRERLIDPLRIATHGDQTYLIAWDVEVDEQRSYRMDKIEGLALTDDSVERHMPASASLHESLSRAEQSAKLAAAGVESRSVTAGVRPVHIALSESGIPAEVDVSELMGSSVHLHISTHDHDVVVIVPTNGNAAHFPMGSEVNMIFGGNVAHVFSKETEKNLEW